MEQKEFRKVAGEIYANIEQILAIRKQTENLGTEFCLTYIKKANETIGTLYFEAIEKLSYLFEASTTEYNRKDCMSIAESLIRTFNPDHLKQ